MTTRAAQARIATRSVARRSTGVAFLREESGWIAVPVVTLLCAFSAGRYGDNFWVSLRGLRGFRWWD
jgi:hypothetical protein